MQVETYYDSEGKQYYSDLGISSHNWDKESDTILYARWNVNQYEITLDKNGGTGGQNTVKVEYNTNIPKVLVPSRTGYTFQGYYDTATGGTQYIDANGNSGIAWTNESINKLYAHWTLNTYTATLDDNKGSGGQGTVGVTFNSAIPTVTKPTREHFTFEGYYDSNGTQYIKADGTSSKNWDKTSSSILYAHWKGNIEVGRTSNGGYAELNVDGYKAILGVNNEPNQQIAGWINIYGDFKKGQEVVINFDFSRTDSTHMDLVIRKGDNSSYSSLDGYNNPYRTDGNGWGWSGWKDSFTMFYEWQNHHIMKYRLTEDSDYIQIYLNKSDTNNRMWARYRIRSITVDGSEVL